MKNYAIVLASGSSSRFEDELPKQFAQIDDKTVLEHCILAFENNPKITDIIVVCNPDYMELSKKILNGKFQKITAIINEGLDCVIDKLSQMTKEIESENKDSFNEAKKIIKR